MMIFIGLTPQEVEHENGTGYLPALIDSLNSYNSPRMQRYRERKLRPIPNREAVRKVVNEYASLTEENGTMIREILKLFSAVRVLDLSEEQFVEFVETLRAYDIDV